MFGDYASSEAPTTKWRENNPFWNNTRLSSLLKIASWRSRKAHGKLVKHTLSRARRRINRVGITQEGRTFKEPSRQQQPTQQQQNEQKKMKKCGAGWMGLLGSSVVLVGGAPEIQSPTRPGRKDRWRAEESLETWERRSCADVWAEWWCGSTTLGVHGTLVVGAVPNGLQSLKVDSGERGGAYLLKKHLIWGATIESVCEIDEKSEDRGP